MRKAQDHLVRRQDASRGVFQRPSTKGGRFCFLLLASLALPALSGCGRAPEPPPPPYTLELLDARLGLGSVTDFTYEPGEHPQYALIASRSGLVYLWSINGQYCTLVYSPGGTKSAVRAARFTPDGSKVIAAYEDGHVAVWSRDGNPLAFHQLPGASFTSLAGTDALKVYIGCADGRLLFWDLNNPQPSQQIQAHKGGVSVLLGGTDRVWSAGGQGEVAAWKTGSLTELARATQKSPVLSLASLADGSRLFGGCDDGSVLDLNTQTLSGQPLAINLGSAVTALDCKGSRVLAGTRGKLLKWWEVGREAAATELKGNQDAIVTAHFTPDGQGGAAGGPEKFIVTSPLSGKLPPNTLAPEMGQMKVALSVAWSPDDQWLAAVGSGPNVLIYQAQTRTLERTLNDQDVRGNLQCVAYAPQGGLLAAGGEDGSVRLFNREGKRVGLGLHAAQVNQLAFSSDGRILASSSWDHSISLWRVSPQADKDALQPLRTLKGHSNAVSSVDFSPDGTRLVSASWDHSVRLWDPQAGSEIQHFGDVAGPIFSCAFSPQASTDFCAGGWHGQIWLYKAGSAKPQEASPAIHKDVVWTVAYSPDGQVIAAGSADRTVSFRLASTGQSVMGANSTPRTLGGFHGGVRTLAWSHDRQKLALGTSVGEIMVLQVPEETHVAPAPRKP